VAAAGLSSATEAAQLDPLMAETRAGWADAPADRTVIASLREAQAPLPALHLSCGLNDPFLAGNRRLHAELQAAGIVHQHVEHEGGHDWTYWSTHLDDTLRFFGQVLQRRGTAA
jgi:enterochelin esterase-like enzyme